MEISILILHLFNYFTRSYNDASLHMALKQSYPSVMEKNFLYFLYLYASLI